LTGSPAGYKFDRIAKRNRREAPCTKKETQNLDIKQQSNPITGKKSLQLAG
jgi:hypothetical protein